jgi:hypothetical protein
MHVEVVIVEPGTNETRASADLWAEDGRVLIQPIVGTADEIRQVLPRELHEETENPISPQTEGEKWLWQLAEAVRGPSVFATLVTHGEAHMFGPPHRDEIGL